MRHRAQLFITILAFAALLGCQARAQISRPSESQIQSASDAFHEYNSGNTIDQILRTLHPGRKGPVVLKRTYDPYDSGEVLSDLNQYPDNQSGY
jgi:nitrous oxide reductase accessory protein NosL